MSMWEFEELAEECVSLVAASDWDVRRKRNAYATAYGMVDRLDVGFVHFRSTSALREAEFFFCIKLEAHPEFGERRDEFERVAAAGRSHWLPSRAEFGEGERPTYDGLYEPDLEDAAPGVWFDATMPLWEKARAAGLLHGLAAEPIELVPLPRFLVELMTLADAGGPVRRDVLKMLHGFVPTALECGKMTVEEAATLETALALPSLPAALAPRSGDSYWIDERFDARNAIGYAEAEHRTFLERWCAPYAAS